MDGKTVQQIRGALLERWNRIGRFDRSLSLVGRDSENELNEAQTEIIDMAQALEQIGRDTSLAEQERRELLAVERALAKMATGNFGICEACDEEILSKRLMVLPEARLCANCQAIEERNDSRWRPAAIAR